MTTPISTNPIISTANAGSASNTSFSNHVGVSSLGSSSLNLSSNSSKDNNNTNSNHIARIVNKASNGFEGLNIVQSGGYAPPDVQLAVGPNGYRTDGKSTR